MIRTDDIERANRFGRLRIAHLILVDHIKLNGQFALGISNDWVWKFAGNIQTVRFNVLSKFKYYDINQMNNLLVEITHTQNKINVHSPNRHGSAVRQLNGPTILRCAF